MKKTSKTVEVYLEVGSQKVFAAALDWPGWCRAGRGEDSALQALLDYGPRYGRVIRPARLGFRVPPSTESFVVARRLRGDATTDFGAPGAVPPEDSRPMKDEERKRLSAVLRACWRALDAAAASAAGKKLRLGPRGGGRSRAAIVEHVLEAEAGYLVMIGRKAASAGGADPDERLMRHRAAVLEALESAVRQGVPARGPRGGKRWPARYFVRRVAWHALDHAWEIEDRSS